MIARESIANIQVQTNGASKAIDILGGATEREKELLEASIKGLKGNIEKGVEFAKNALPK